MVVRHGKILLLLTLVLPAVAACAHVQPWEKEDMATLDAHQSLEASGSGFEAHFWAVREGAAGGTGEAGGGCGCN